MTRRITIALVLSIGLTAGVALAARDSAGTYSRPSGNPVTSGTPITATWANTLTADLATEITDSLSRSGRGPMLAPFKATDGSVTVPAITFNNETGTGLYRVGTGNPAMSVLGSKRQEWTGTGSAVTGTMTVSGLMAAGSLKATSGLVDAYQGVQAGSGLGLELYGLAADGGTAVGVKLGTTTGLAYADAAAKIASFVNGASEKAYVLQTGKGSFYGLDAQSQVVANVATPAASSDAATKGYVDPGLQLAAGYVNGTTGAHIATKGSLTVTPAKSATGTYTLTATGLTANAIILVAGSSTSSRVATVVPASGVATVYTFQSGGATLTDCNFTYSIIAL